ncbi:chromosome segregation ATPase [Grimontia sp. NTOU-MAR1]|uniref:chromosome segregation ATPase n=1 Tax=Grimontia sp. NTOU-MAR1 TaxID=3111011 RepID=UPI002DB89E69|nr:chromosome segregation ATPase [Grimontia sp. NTOU-MAR1]WRV97646.1 chromosome segregation ATPase [Grimontia sp. NTOU-MAR1]
MISIQGLPQQIQRPGKTGRKPTTKKNEARDVSEPSVVAKAVSRGIRNPEMAEDAFQNIHYDLPDGRSRYALASYMDVKNQARREELIAMFGVDVFV